jgi:DNA ligase-1
VRLEDLARASEDIGATRARLAKIDRLAGLLRAASPEEVPVAVAFLSGELRQGSIGVGWASLRELPPPAEAASVDLLEVDRTLAEVGTTTGAGSQLRRKALLHSVFGRLTERERAFLTGLLLGELRQGALEGIMAEAVAKAAGVPAAEVRRATMLSGDLGEVAAEAVGSGLTGLARFRLTIFRPVQPMLAQTADGVDDALGRISPAAVEWKLDGARIQVHRAGDEVRIYTRNLAEVTPRLPEVVEAVGRLPVEQAVLDGEAIALRQDARPHPFQVSMSRFGTRVAAEDLRRQVPLSPFFFDLLHLDGEDLIDRPAEERAAAMRSRLPEALMPPRIVTADVEEARGFLDDALARGHEGVMVKALDAPYEAGRRGAGWLKVKRAHTLDLVVLAAEWGHGRRQGWLSNLHLGARDPETGGFVMLGKTFKGMTDELLAWQTARFQELEVRRDRWTVYVRPELVVEVAFDGLQASTRYPAGLALRFARIKGYRPDKGPEDADTIETVRAIHAGERLSR